VTKRRPGTPKHSPQYPHRPTANKPTKATRTAKAGSGRNKRGGQKALFGSFESNPPAPASAPTAEETQRHRESREAALAAIEAALEKKALMPLLLDVSGRATYTDFIGVVSGRSDRQVDAIAANVREVMERRGWRLLGREGAGNGRWTLLDFGDVVLHVFYHPVREIYDIEGLWIDAPRVELQIPPEAQLYQSDALYGAL
jgi:ribosome-associated protein